MKPKGFRRLDLDAKWTPGRPSTVFWTPLGLQLARHSFLGLGDRDVSGLRNAGYEWTRAGMQNSANPRQCLQEDPGDLDAPQIPGSQDEYSGVAGPKRGDLQRAISQSLIFGQHNPAALADPLEPDAVFLVTSEMVVVNFDGEAGVDEFRPDWLYARDRSMKNTVPSGGFAADCFFDRTDLQTEVPRKIRDGIAGFVSLVDG